ncbi:hypothetical protein INT45_012346 [Circinella minor]|uniref:Uncharacterized protein n=1 Tax=Circinella minor TaxID=1195481 RepID=A0A8H7RZT2_9FUNG|nr:hypothetical protein INT45_012346 [Circinella minor]
MDPTIINVFNQIAQQVVAMVGSLVEAKVEVVLAPPTKRPNQQETLAEKFALFKKNIVLKSKEGQGFNLESGVPELMALSDVMLLKPSQFTKHTRSHFGDSVLSKWYKSTVESLLENGEGAGTSIAKDIEGASASNITEDLGDIVYDLMKGRSIKTRQAVQRLVEISRNKENAEAQVLIGLSNLIQKLPRKKLLDNTTVGGNRALEWAIRPNAVCSVF